MTACNWLIFALLALPPALLAGFAFVDSIFDGEIVTWPLLFAGVWILGLALLFY